MKKTFGLLFSFISLLAFSQMQTYKFENAVSYRIKDDFYSNFLNILSTSDYSTNIFIVATPMGNIATLNINDRYYVVYSDDGKVFKIDVEETFDRNKYKNNDDPNLDLTDYKNDFILKKTNEQETIKSKQCDVYSIANANKDIEDRDETFCIDTTSKLNTVPFLLPSIKNSIKGLIYRIGNNIELNKAGTIDSIRKEEESEDDEASQSSNVRNKKRDDLFIQFDEKAETENYKREYHKKNKGS